MAIILLGVLILLVIGFFAFGGKDKCANYECYKENVESCSRAIYVNDESQASWRYEIKGRSGENCAVEVTLLQAKEGELNINKLVGKKMICYDKIGKSGYPEKDLGKCEGSLKEGIQGIIIEKLHKYIVENLGTLDKELNGI